MCCHNSVVRGGGGGGNYLNSVHMAKAPTLQASPGLPQMSAACPSHSGVDSESVCDANCSTCQTDTFSQAWSMSR